MDIEFCDCPCQTAESLGDGERGAGGGGVGGHLIETEHFFRGLRACFGVMLFPPCP